MEGRQLTVGRSALLLSIAAVLVAGSAFLLVVRQHGISARSEPLAIEALLARSLRRLAIPASARDAVNPVPATEEALAEGRAHFADHCAQCHANDGSGRTAIGQNLYPKAPDMRTRDTQNLTDGDIFYLIFNGIRLTGMPAWGAEDAQSTAETWKLVHFIRQLPHLSDAELMEMESLNPKTPDQLEEEAAAKRFLQGPTTDVTNRHGGH